MEHKNIDFDQHFIACPATGGTRCAACCVYFDRYKGCRRHCASLNKHLTANPTLIEEVRKYYEEKKKTKPQEDANKFFGQFLPTPELNCMFCKFIAKSARGLKIHMRRTHKKPVAK